MADNGFTRQQSVKFGQLRLFLPFRQRLLKLLLGVLVVRIRSKQFLQQIAATLHPAFHIGRLLPLRRHISQSTDKFGKTAEHVQLVDITMPRAHTLPHTVAAFRQHPAQGQTLYRLLPSKEVVFALAHGLVQTPMHIQSGNSLMQQRHIFLAQTEALQHQPAFQQRQNLVHFKPAFQQVQSLRQSIQQRLTAAEFHIRNRIRQSLATCMLLPKNGFDKRAVRLDVWRQNGNIVRLPVGIVLQHQRQLFFQNLQFAQRAVRHDDFNGAVIQQLVRLDTHWIAVRIVDLNQNRLRACFAFFLLI